jgi:uncharacterized protein (TIGR00730 family)
MTQTSEKQRGLKELKEQRKHLDERLQSLNRRTAIIEKQLLELEDKRFYRVCIFGSARLKSDSREYNQVVRLAHMLASERIDILTGGGPGLMEAANKGAIEGQKESKSKSRSFGISIELSYEPTPNHHLDVKRHHQKFSSRLDDFMRLSHSVVVTPGGIGTVLEIFFTWQLIQVKHIGPRPLVLLDVEFWSGLIEWMKKHPLGRKLMNPEDFDCITLVDTPEEAAAVIKKHYEKFRVNNPLV